MEVSETSDNSGVQKSSETVSESSQEDKQNGVVITTKKQTTTTADGDDQESTTTVVIKKKVIVKNPSKEENVETTIKKIDKKPSQDEEIIEYVESNDNNVNDDDDENVETVVETVVIKKTSNNQSNNDEKSQDNDKAGGETTTTTTTITKKKLVAKDDSIDSKESIPNQNIKLSQENDDNKSESTTKSPASNEEKKNVEDKPKKAVEIEKVEETEKQSSPKEKIEKKVEEQEDIIEEEVEEEEEEEEEVEEIKPQKELVTKSTIKEEPEEEIEEEIEEEEAEDEVEEEIEEEVVEEKKQSKEKETTPDNEKSIKQEKIDDKSQLDGSKMLQQEPQQQQQQLKQQIQQPKVGTENCENIMLNSLTSSSDIKQNIKNQLKDIISDIDRIIKQDNDVIQSTPTTRQQPIPSQQYNQQQYQQQQQQLPPVVQQQHYQPQQEQQPPRQVSNLTTREETQEDGYIKKRETIERNEIQDHGDGRTEVRSTETKTIIQASHPPSVTFYNSNLPSHQQQYQQSQEQHHLPSYTIPYGQTEPNYLLNDPDLKGHRSLSLPSHNQYVSEQTSSSTTKRVDLQKIFTPATDADELLPKTNRKLYSSSAFYSPNLHPTVEDQVELARRISHSLSDISNQQSKGQTMYVNRKKRSVKWVHEGEGRADIPEFNGYHHEEYKENESYGYHDKLPLKLVMNPRGQVRDFSSVRQEYNTDSGLLSPDKCAELVAGLNAPKGKGAELFAKRRKKSEKWIVDETNAAQSSPSGVTPYQSSSPNILPAYSDVGRQRVQLNMHQDQLTDLYAQQYGQQRVKLVKTPWEAALETGSAAAAFESDLPNLKQPSSFQPQQQSSNIYSQSAYSSGPVSTDYQSSQSYYETSESTKLPKATHYQPKTGWQPNNQRDLAYKPSIPQGWNAPPTSLPRELYVPKEIPLDGYNPPSTEKYLPTNPGAYQSPSGGGLSAGGIGSVGGYSTNYSSGISSNTYSPSFSNYGSGVLQQPASCTSYDNTSSHYETTTKSFPLSSTYQQQQQQQQEHQQHQKQHSSYESSTTISSSTQRQTGDYGGGNSSSLYSTLSGSNVGQQQLHQSQQQQQQQQQQSHQQQQYFPVSNKPSSYYSAPPSYKAVHNWKTQSGVSNHPSTNFNPSPLPYEKLAKFENPDPDDLTSYSQYYPSHSIPIRSPSKPRNLSPLPYLSSSAPTGTGGIIGTGNISGGGGSIVGGGGGGISAPYASKLSPNPISHISGGGGCGGIGGFSTSGSLNKCKNYNTAARGWNQSGNSYKPITFVKSGSCGINAARSSIPATGGANMPYTDF